MAPHTIYPRSNAECIALLNTLGFKKRLGIGRGKHPEKYTHPTRQNQNPNDKPFVLITHEYFDANGKRLMKKLQNWGFTKKELELACRGIVPAYKPPKAESDQDPDIDIDIEPEVA